MSTTAPTHIKYRGQLYRRADAGQYATPAAGMIRALTAPGFRNVKADVIASFIEYGNAGGPPIPPATRLAQVNAAAKLLRDLVLHYGEMQAAERDEL
jgi:hypothetical protein